MAEREGGRQRKRVQVGYTAGHGAGIRSNVPTFSSEKIQVTADPGQTLPVRAFPG